MNKLSKIFLLMILVLGIFVAVLSPVYLIVENFILKNVLPKEFMAILLPVVIINFIMAVIMLFFIIVIIFIGYQDKHKNKIN